MKKADPDELEKALLTFVISTKSAALIKVQDMIDDQLEWRKNHKCEAKLIQEDMVISGSKYKLSALRSEALQILGGRCCACGEHDVRCLEIDHVMGDGNIERKDKSQKSIMNKLIRTGGLGYQCLCANCHRKKTHATGEFS